MDGFTLFYDILGAKLDLVHHLLTHSSTIIFLHLGLGFNSPGKHFNKICRSYPFLEYYKSHTVHTIPAHIYISLLSGIGGRIVPEQWEENVYLSLSPKP